MSITMHTTITNCSSVRRNYSMVPFEFWIRQFQLVRLKFALYKYFQVCGCATRMNIPLHQRTEQCNSVRNIRIVANAIYFILYILSEDVIKLNGRLTAWLLPWFSQMMMEIKYIGAISKAEKRKCAKWKQTGEHLLLLHCTEQLLGTNSMVCKSWQHITRQRQQFNTDHLAFAC